MNKFLVVVFFTSFSSLHAKNFYFMNKPLAAKRYKKRAWISSSCHSCLATEAASKVKVIKSKTDSRIGTPGSKICLSLKNTRVVNFHTKNSEVGFCIFKDNSFISTEGLYQIAILNSKK